MSDFLASSRIKLHIYENKAKHFMRIEVIKFKSQSCKFTRIELTRIKKDVNHLVKFMRSRTHNRSPSLEEEKPSVSRGKMRTAERFAQLCFSRFHR